MCRSSTTTVGMPGFFWWWARTDWTLLAFLAFFFFGASAFLGTSVSCGSCGAPGSSAFTCDSSSASSATAVPLFGAPEVPEADDQCEHRPEYASHPDPRPRLVAGDEEVAHELDVGGCRIGVQDVGDDGGKARALHPGADGEEHARGVEPGAHDEREQLVHVAGGGPDASQ